MDLLEMLLQSALVQDPRSFVRVEGRPYVDEVVLSNSQLLYFCYIISLMIFRPVERWRKAVAGPAAWWRALCSAAGEPDGGVPASKAGVCGAASAGGSTSGGGVLARIRPGLAGWRRLIFLVRNKESLTDSPRF